MSASPLLPSIPEHYAIAKALGTLPHLLSLLDYFMHSACPPEF